MLYYKVYIGKYFNPFFAMISHSEYVNIAESRVQTQIPAI